MDSQKEEKPPILDFVSDDSNSEPEQVKDEGEKKVVIK
jgi:hypothetical protein